jgi:hypothetical protein
METTDYNREYMPRGEDGDRNIEFGFVDSKGEAHKVATVYMHKRWGSNWVVEVNWSAWGSQTAETTTAFIRRLTSATAMAQEWQLIANARNAELTIKRDAEVRDALVKILGSAPCRSCGFGPMTDGGWPADESSNGLPYCPNCQEAIS